MKNLLLQLKLSQQQSKQQEITLDGTDAEGAVLTYSIADQPSNGTVSLDDNTATYTSTSDTATSDSFTFKVNDGNSDSDAATITINITAVNDKPTATAQTVTLEEQTAKTITLAGTDADDDNITYIIVSLPSEGTLTDNGTAITSDDLPKSTTGTDVVYTSTSYTASSDSFTFKVNDGTLDSDIATITLNITDNTSPSITISSTTVDDGDTSRDSSIDLVFTTSEPTTNFISDDITVTGGSISDFNSTSSTVYTATFTPSSSGETTINVASNTFTDDAGNSNTAATQFNWIYDDSYSGTNISGLINSDITWTLGKSPYIITGNVLVNSGVTLTIEPGVTVKFNDDLYLKIEGIIKAVGTSSKKIVFESNNSSQNKSDWSGIRIRPSSSTSIDANQDYSSGSQFKYVTIKNADIGLYVYDTGLHTSYTTFENNNKGFEIRKTDGVVIDNSTFTDNTTGIWSEYETFSPDDTTGNILNTYIRNSTFSNNGNAIDLIINQRYFENLKIYNNVVKENTIGIDFSGGGYGCRVKSVYIYKNIIIDNTQYGIMVGQIYGYADNSEPDGVSPFKFYDNKVINNSIYWNYGGGISGVTTKIFNNIIYNPRSYDANGNGIWFEGGTSKKDTITNNLIVSNSKAITFRDSYSDPNNKHISYNTIIGGPINDGKIQ